MISQQTLDHARPSRTRVDKPEFAGFKTELINPELVSTTPRPQAFLVEQTSNWTLPTHFHEEHQFQVFVAGGGFLGKHPIEHLAVHYASPHSAYGPLISGEEGISYFTLRAVGDVGAWYMPEQRAHLQLRIPKRQAHGAPSTHMTDEELRALTQAQEETLIPAEESGLAAWMVRVPAGQTIAPPTTQHAGGGRFYVVTQGSLLRGQEELLGLATVFVSNDDKIELQAGPNGLQVIILQYPLAGASSFIEAQKRNQTGQSA